MGSAINFDEFYATGNPLDVMASLANENQWQYVRNSDEEIILEVEGVANYQLTLNWHKELEVMHMACAFDQTAPEGSSLEIYRLIANINEQLWVGHFDLWSNGGVILFRHSLLLNNTEATREQCSALLQTGLETCEQYFSAFEFVLQEGHSAPDAMATTMFDTQGCA